MKCTKCNREVGDTSKFCPYCGTNLEEVPSNSDNMQNAEQPVYGYEQPTEQNAEQSVYEYEQPTEQNAEKEIPYWERKPEKTSKRKLVIPCVMLALVLVVGCVGFAMKDTLKNVFQKQFASDLEYYRYVEETNRDKAVDSFFSGYDKYVSQDESETIKNFSIKLEPGEQLKSTISAMGMDVSELDSVTLAASNASTSNICDVVYDLQINDSDFLKAKLYADFEEEKMYVQVPEVSETYLDLSYIFDSYTDEEKTFFSAWEDYASLMPEVDTLKKSIYTYSDILFEGAEEAEKSSATLTAAGVSQKCTKISVSYNEAAIKDVTRKLVEAAKEDETVKQFLEKIDDLSSSTTVSEYTKSMEEALEELEALEPSEIDGTIAMDVYVDGEGDIIGRVIQVESDEENVIFSLCKSVAGGKIGVEYKANVNGQDVLCFEGAGTLKEDAVTGDFTFSASGEDGESVEIYITAEDYKTLEDGFASGTLSFSMDTLPGASLDLAFAEQKAEKTVQIGVSYSGVEWGTITLATDSDGETASAEPEEDAAFCDINDEEQLQTYYGEVAENIYGLLSRLSELTGIDEDTWYRILGIGDSLGVDTDYEDSNYDDYDYEDADYDEDDDDSLLYHEGVDSEVDHEHSFGKV